jgi:hypothetical protein
VVPKPKKATIEPIALQRVSQFEAEACTMFDAIAPAIRSEKVLTFRIEPSKPYSLIAANELGARFLREIEVEVEMPSPNVGAFGRLSQSLLRILPHCIELSIALALRLKHDKRFLHELR